VSRKHKQVFKFRPKVKQRPRLGRRGRVFTPAQTLEFERQVREAWDGFCAEKPVSLVITLYKDKFTVTVTEYDTLEPSPLRGDIDNYAKSILDGLNGVAYTDDKLVYKLQVTKRG
jgi:crossover junction endodeoxyribonuclease RusA